MTERPYDLTGADHDMPAWQGPPRRSVVIATHPRSGSSLLGEAIYFAGGLGCPLEYFHQGFRPGLAARWGTETLADHVAAAHRLRTDPSGDFAVKLFWRDIEEMAAERDPARFADLAQRQPEAVDAEGYRAIAALIDDVIPNAAFVHLARTDRVRQAVSGLAATQTGVFRVIPDAERAPKAAPEYDFDRIDALVAYSDRCHGHWRNFFAAIGVAPLAVTYEALVADYAGNVRRVLDHFGSAALVPPIRMQRQSGAENEGFVLRYLREHRARTGGA